jgi:hypothetical protein
LGFCQDKVSADDGGPNRAAIRNLGAAPFPCPFIRLLNSRLHRIFMLNCRAVQTSNRPPTSSTLYSGVHPDSQFIHRASNTFPLYHAYTLLDSHTIFDFSSD